MKKSPLLSCLAGAATLGLLAFSSGCGTQGPRDMMADAVTAGERPVAMKGEGPLLEGKIVAYATVSRGFERGNKGGKGGGPQKKGGPEEFDNTGRRRKDSDGITDVYYTGFGDSEEEQKEAMEEYVRMAKARRAQGSPMPPVTLRVSFENKTAQPIEIEVTDINSDLGNFAVRPPKLTIAPGEKGVLEPMVSQLGVTSDEIPLQVAVRYGGKKELQVINVKNVIMPSVMKQAQ